ncbi:MAG TPA: tetratricopeptide repeat protein [Candidatus Bathyarchaeia archaeon]|nr:tetratricopeptide repeat protein [Candidatus Bathyarchaeia archaeon]
MRIRIFTCTVVLVLVASVCAPAQPQNDARSRAEALFVDAQKALSRGDSEGAEALLKEALTKDPSFTSAIWQLAQIYESRGKLDYARELLVRGLQQDPGASWARERLAQLESTLERATLAEARSAMNSKDYDVAIPKLSSYLGVKPDDPTALLLMAKCQLAKGQTKMAREYLSRAHAAEPGNAEIASLTADIDKRERGSRLEKLLGDAQLALMDTTSEGLAKARVALTAVISEDPANAWAKEQLAELNRSAQRVSAPRASAHPVPAAVVERGREAISDSRGALTMVGHFTLAHLTTFVLAAVLCVLVIDVRRRTLRRNYPLEGTIALIPILDIVSLVNSNLRTGRLIIVNTDSKGEIYFDKGDIIHARCDRLTGKLAFHKLMDLRSGRFFFHNHLPNVRHTISEPLSLLLLSMKPNEESAPEPERDAGREELLSTRR